MDRFETAAWGTYMYILCLLSAGGKLIIIKQLWASSYGKGATDINAPLYLHFNNPPGDTLYVTVWGDLTDLMCVGL